MPTSKCPGESGHNCSPPSCAPGRDHHYFEMVCHPMSNVKPPPSPPMPRKKIRYCLGGGPCWKFAGGRFLEKAMKRQRGAVKRLDDVKKQRVDMEYYIMKGVHQEVMDRVGPDWYQELTPKQLKAAENLKKAILLDKRFKSIVNCQENIGELGLVLRPNHKHVQTALQYCCEDSVEFLLILYQLIKPHRTKYSLNDRLLLSAVVHLSMIDTLMELHKRLPSPPKTVTTCTFKRTTKKKQVPKKWESPYLEIATYKPPPRPHAGEIYKNNVTQYPESPYFAYLPELRKLQMLAPDYGDVEDMKVSKRKTPKTLTQREQLKRDLIKETLLAQEYYDKLVAFPPAPRLLKPTVYESCLSYEEPTKGQAEETALSVDVKITTTYDDRNNITNKVCQCTITLNEDTTAVQDITSAHPSSNTPSTAEPAHSASAPLPAESTHGPRMLPEDVTTQKYYFESKDRAVNTVKSNQLIDTNSDFEQNLELVDGRIIQKKDLPKECTCKDGVLEQAHKNVCECDKCKADHKAWQEKQAAIRVISRLAIDKEEDNTIPVIEATKPKDTCTCLQKYLEQVQTYMEMKKRIGAGHKLKTMGKQYVIGGVVVDAEGEPSFKLDAPIPEKECECLEKFQRYMEHQEYLKTKAKMSKGRQQYVISGVRESSDGNVFILSQALPMEDCHCMKIYKHYEKVHHNCMETYYNYLQKIEEDKTEYLAELELDQRFAEEKRAAAIEVDDAIQTSEISIEKVEDIEVVERAEQRSHNRVLTSEDGKNEDRVAEEEFAEAKSSRMEPVEVCPCSGDAFRTETNFSLSVDMTQPKLCICGLEVDDVADSQVCKCDEELSIHSTEVPLTRFLILEKIPCEYKEQLNILKKVLSVMANDGYPLAKLPNCHLLPHFRLWMQMRCGKFWSWKERQQLLKVSEFYWRHTRRCYRKTKMVSLDITADEARNYTWAHAPTVRRIATEKNEFYYSMVKQNVIGDGREFYPTTFSYEFPTVGFRDCFFAYVPAKQEGCFSYRPWMEHERKDPARSQKVNKC